MKRQPRLQAILKNTATQTFQDQVINSLILGYPRMLRVIKYINTVLMDWRYTIGISTKSSKNMLIQAQLNNISSKGYVGGW